MSDSEDNLPLVKPKTKRPYQMTPAREEAVKRMMEKRRQNVEIRRAQKILDAQETLNKHEVKEVKSKTSQPKLKAKIVEKQQEQIADDDYESEEELAKPIPKQKAKKQPKIVYQEESESEEEVVIVKKKKSKPKKVVYQEESSEDEKIPMQKERPTVSKQSTKAKSINVTQPETKVDYSKFFV